MASLDLGDGLDVRTTSQRDGTVRLTIDAGDIVLTITRSAEHMTRLAHQLLDSARRAERSLEAARATLPEPDPEHGDPMSPADLGNEEPPSDPDRTFAVAG